MAERRIVFDTNVLVSAALTEGVCRRLLELWLVEDAFDLVMCPYLYGEFSRVMGRPKIRRVVSPELADAILGSLAFGAQWHPDPIRVSRITRDSFDDPVVQFARDVKADLLISGDGDLVTREVARVVRVAEPAQAWRILRSWHS